MSKQITFGKSYIKEIYSCFCNCGAHHHRKYRLQERTYTRRSHFHHGSKKHFQIISLSLILSGSKDPAGWKQALSEQQRPKDQILKDTKIVF